jgi:2-oxoglutarate ferredoxin oxidoreductase subunit beta
MNTVYKREDFENDTEVRWCPGCGDYAILAALQKVLPELGLPPERHVFVSGIGCAGRLPYYMNAYGFHTIHGRATAVATGLKAMREDLAVWVITGDGDALSIGGNHLIHCLRRNLNLTILLINNQVYGLTKGQFSPTSQKGQITKTSPQGVSQQPINPLALALAAGATFVARAVDKDPNHLASILHKAHAHQGCSFVEIYQDCNIFNNQYILDLIDDDLQTLAYEEGKGYKHDSQNFNQAMRLARLHFPEFPVPLGVYYQQQREVFNLQPQITKSMDDLAALYRKKASWKQGA